MRKNSNHPHYRCTITLLFNLIITFCLLFPLLVKSQEFAIYNYPSNILPDLETITTIFQDSRGYLWFGGYQGAAYYDGLTFHRFSVQNGLADNYVYTIKESPTGEIWIGTWLGISMYDPVTNIMKRILPYFNDTAVRDIHFTDQGVLIGASGEAYCIQGSGIYTVLQFYNTEGNPEGSPILAIDYDVEDRIAWFATEYFEVVAVDLSRLVKLWEMKDKSVENKYREMESEKFFTIFSEAVGL